MLGWAENKLSITKFEYKFKFQNCNSVKENIHYYNFEVTDMISIILLTKYFSIFFVDCQDSGELKYANNFFVHSVQIDFQY